MSKVEERSQILVIIRSFSLFRSSGLFSSSSLFTKLLLFVCCFTPFFEFLFSEDQLLRVDTFRLLPSKFPASLLHQLLVVVELQGLVDDAPEPVGVAGDLGVPAGDTFATAYAAGHDPYQSLLLLRVDLLGVERPATVSLAGPAEEPPLLEALSAEQTVQTVGQSLSPLRPDTDLLGDVVSQHLLALLVAYDVDVGYQEVAPGPLLGLAVPLDGGGCSAVDLLFGALVKADWTVLVLEA